MNNSFLLIPLLFSTMSLFGQEEKVKVSIFRAAAIVGFNGSQVDGDDMAGYRKYGLNAGGAAYILLPKNFSVNFEILYSQKGARKAAFHIENRLPDKIILDYVDVPLLINYHDKGSKGTDVAIFGLGVIFTNLVRSKWIDEFGYEVDTIPYHRFGIEGVANIAFVFAKKFGINLRFAYSLTNLAKVPIGISRLTNNGQRNNYFSIRGMYYF